MAAEMIDGRAVAAEIDAETAVLLEGASGRGRRAAIAVLSIGRDPAAESYSRQKERLASKLGIDYRNIVAEADESEQQIIGRIDSLATDPGLDAILVHTPIPDRYNAQRILDRIPADMDVDCCSTNNRGLMYSGQPLHAPATAQAVVEIMTRRGLGPSGRHVVVIGRSMVVGKPLAVLLLRKGAGGDATVTVCHSRTKSMERYTRLADVLVCAIGSPGYVTGEMVSPGAAVIDVGINSVPSGTSKTGFRLVGDADFDSVAAKAGHLTPVPGGVGPVTTSVLMNNVAKAFAAKARRSDC